VGRYIQPNTEPENGWQYVQPETGEWIDCRGENFAALIERVVQHRRYKGLKPDDHAAVQVDIERQLCLGIKNGCRPEPGDIEVKDQFRGITGDSIIAASRALFSFVKSGGQLVEKTESERRAAICRGCKFNRLSGTCMCNAVFALIKSIIPSSRIEPGLKACGVCGCSLEAKVLVPPDVLRDSEPTPGYAYPSWCWIPSQLS